MSAGCGSTPDIGPSVAATPASDARSAPARLAACPSSPNCVSSTADDPDRRVAAFDIASLSASQYQAQLITVIESDGGLVRDIREGYLWATYTSSVFRFVDDIEWLIDSASGQYHVRSASRLGYSDLGANRKRVERLRARMSKL